MAPLTRAPVGLEPTRSGRCPAHNTGLSATPTGPTPSLAGCRFGACHATVGASRVASIPLFHACRRQYPGGTARCVCRSLPSRWRPSPYSRRVGFRITNFEACSAFTRVAARMVAEPPKAARFIGVLQTMSLPPSSAPTATGWSDSCRAGLATRWGMAPCTAHSSLMAILCSRSGWGIGSAIAATDNRSERRIAAVLALSPETDRLYSAASENAFTASELKIER